MGENQDPGYKKLLAWQRADALAFSIYQLTGKFPKSEVYALTSQLRRAALSVPTNIVEGYARNGKPEFKRFLVIALGSLAEVKYLISFSVRLQYVAETDSDRVFVLLEETGQLLWKLYTSL